MSKLRTHYDNLKIARNAPDTIIRSAYKALIQKYHPDKFDGSVEEALRVTKIINHSYEVLIDPTKRAKHNRWINTQEAKFNQTNIGAQFDFKRNISDQYSYKKSETQNFYTEKELYNLAKKNFSSKRRNHKKSVTDHRIYYSALSFLGALLLFMSAVASRSSILITISVFLLLSQPVYITYIFASRLINIFYGKR